MNGYIENYLNNGYKIIAGVDEAGRGSLAGPVFAAVVILSVNHDIEGLNDSKKLSEKKRELLYGKIINEALDYAIDSASEKEIDEVNILQATFLAMNRAVSKLTIKPDLILVDGNQDPGLDFKTECIVKGDNLVDSISAASILAKVARDRYMKELSEKFSQYGWEKNKGYGTKEHYNAIQKFGLSEVHRRSFFKKVIGSNYLV